MSDEVHACRDPDRLLDVLGERLDPATLRAFAVACCRQVRARLDGRGRHAVDVAGRFTEGLATEADLDAARAALNGLGEDEAQKAAWYCVWRDPRIAARESAWYAAAAATGRRAPKAQWDAERAAQVMLLLRLTGLSPLEAG